MIGVSLIKNILFQSQDERAFSEEEEIKLQGALELEANDLHVVLETAAFILEQVTQIYFAEWNSVNH